MSGSIKLRDYQRDAIDALYAWFASHKDGNPLMILSTGSGKSIIIAAMIREIMESWPEQRIIMLTHVKELIEQNVKKLKSVWPRAPIGIFSAGLRSKDSFESIIFASIQSAANHAMQFGHRDLILIDEVHLVSHLAHGQYRKFLHEMAEINPAVRIVGLTATPFRMGHGSIMHGEHALFHDIAYEIGMLELIEKGYLAPLISKPTAAAAQIDTSQVQTRNGEFIGRQLELAADQANITEAALDECERLASNRKHWLVFCSGVTHAGHVADALTSRGIEAGVVTGSTPRQARSNLIARYRSGQLRALVSVGVLTTGFDAPETDLIVFLRPTQSPGLYVQMAGRGSRIAPGKVNALILDFAGNALRHGPVDSIRAWVPKNTDPGEAPQKTCPECQSLVAASAKRCPNCGHEFPDPEVTQKHDAYASDAAILSTEQDAVLERHHVSNVEYRRHHGRMGKTDTLRVTYHNGIERVASEWVCLEHQGFPRTKAVLWWQTRARTNTPDTINEAIERCDELKTPDFVVLNVRPKYPEIVNYEFPGELSQQQPYCNDVEQGANTSALAVMP